MWEVNGIFDSMPLLPLNAPYVPPIKHYPCYAIAVAIDRSKTVNANIKYMQRARSDKEGVGLSLVDFGTLPNKTHCKYEDFFGKANILKTLIIR